MLWSKYHNWLLSFFVLNKVIGNFLSVPDRDGLFQPTLWQEGPKRDFQWLASSKTVSICEFHVSLVFIWFKNVIHSVSNFIQVWQWHGDKFNLGWKCAQELNTWFEFIKYLHKEVPLNSYQLYLKSEIISGYSLNMVRIWHQKRKIKRFHLHWRFSGISHYVDKSDCGGT